MNSEKCLKSVENSLPLMTLDTELSLPVIYEHELSLGRMHAVTGDTRYRLTVTRVFHIRAKWMGNFMLLYMAPCTCFDIICPKIEMIVRMRWYMALKTLPFFYWRAPNRFERSLHDGCALLNFFMALEAEHRFFYCQVLPL